MPQGSPEDSVSNHLANERTFLAWLRTGISFISLGIAINRFGLYLTKLESERGVDPGRARTLLFDSESLGLGMILFGMGAILLSAWRYDAVRRRLARGDFRPDVIFVRLAAAAIFLFGGIALFGLFRR